MDESLEVVRRHRAAGTLLRRERQDLRAVLARPGERRLLGPAGRPASTAAQGAPFAAFAPFLTRMATIDPTVAGLASVHGCIGAVDPLRTFGTPEQKARYLPRLASGERLSAFALTEPGAGSDLTALRTTAELDGDDYVVNGEKLFITNAVPGRTVGLVCLIDEQAGGPDRRPARPRGRAFPDRPVRPVRAEALAQQRPAVPRLPRARARTCSGPTGGDGLTIAYHGLNLGRVALCATAAGLDAGDAGQHAPLGPLPPDLRRGDRDPRAGPAADRPARRR